MLMPSGVAGRTLGIRGPDLSHGPEVAYNWYRICCKLLHLDFDRGQVTVSTTLCYYYDSHSTNY